MSRNSVQRPSRLILSAWAGLIIALGLAGLVAARASADSTACGALSVADPAGEVGAASDPCLISTDSDLDAAMAMINSDTAHDGASTLSYKLTADLDYSKDGSNSTGAATGAWTGIDFFGGTFDGDGHTISNVTYAVDGATAPIPGTAASGKDLGFFKILDGATVKNLTMENVVVPSGAVASQSVGGLSASSFNSSVTGVSIASPSITAVAGGGGSYVGGLVAVSFANGYADDGSTVSDGGQTTFTDDSVAGGTVTHANATGGIVGYANGPTVVADDYVDMTLANPSHASDGNNGAQVDDYYYAIGGLVGEVGTSYTVSGGGLAAGVSMTNNVIDGTIKGGAPGPRSDAAGQNFASPTVGYATTESYVGVSPAPEAGNWSTANDLVSSALVYIDEEGPGLPGADGTSVSPETLATESTFAGSATNRTDATTGATFDELAWNFGAAAVRPWVWNGTPAAGSPSLEAGADLRVEDTTIMVPVGSEPSEAALLSDAGVTVKSGTATIDTSNVNWAADGSYPATITVAGAFGAPVSVAIVVYTPGNVIVNNPTVSFSASATAPSDAVVVNALGAMLPPGATGPLAIDLTGAVPGDQAVNWDQIGSYTVTVSDTNGADGLASRTATIVISGARTVSVTQQTVYFNVANPPTAAAVIAASGAAVVDADGNPVSGGALSATLSTSPITAAGNYTAEISATDTAGDTIIPVTVNVVVADAEIALANTTPVFQVSDTAPSIAEVVAAAKATVSNGTGQPTVDLTGAISGDQAVDFTKPGEYRVTLTDTAADDVAPAVTATIEIVPVSVLTVSDRTVYFNVGDPPASGSVLSAAGAKITDGSGNTVAGSLTASTPVGCAATAGSCTAVVSGSDMYGFAVGPVDVTVNVSAAAVAVSHSTATFTARGSAPTQSAMISALGATLTSSTTGGSIAIDTSGVDWNLPGNYTVTVEDSSSIDKARTVSATIKLVPVPVVSAPVKAVYLPASATNPLPAATLLANAEATLTDGQGNLIDGTLSADTSGVDGSVAGTYAATITGTDAFGFTSAPLTLNVVIYLASQKAGTVSIDGTPAVGSTLTASPAGWEDLSAPEYQWLRDGQPIAGATEAAYAVVTADAGRSLSVKMTEAPAWYLPASATSAAVAVPAIPAGREETGTGSGSGATPTPTPTPGPSKGGPSAPKVSVTNHNGSAKVTVDCAATARVCIGTVTVTTAAKSPLKVGKTTRRGYRTLGRAKFRVEGGQTRSLLVALNKRGKRLLALSTRPLKVRVVVASRAGDASAKRTVVITLAPGK